MALDSPSPETSPELSQIIPFKSPSSTDRPILLPTQVPPPPHSQLTIQRKIRHIRGLVCRNIALNPPTRARSSTQDDDTLQTSWQSPSKFLVQVDDGPHQSLSSSDLKDMMKRPAKVMRRRSTKVYHLGALEDSVCRQKRWEKVVAGKLVDLFFTLHRTAKGNPRWAGINTRWSVVYQWASLWDDGIFPVSSG